MLQKFQTSAGRIVYHDNILNVVQSPRYQNDIMKLSTLFPATSLQLEAMEASGTIRKVF